MLKKNIFCFKSKWTLETEIRRFIWIQFFCFFWKVQWTHTITMVPLYLLCDKIMVTINNSTIIFLTFSAKQFLEIFKVRDWFWSTYCLNFKILFAGKFPQSYKRLSYTVNVKKIKFEEKENRKNVFREKCWKKLSALFCISFNCGWTSSNEKFLIVFELKYFFDF